MFFLSDENRVNVKLMKFNILLDKEIVNVFAFYFITPYLLITLLKFLLETFHFPYRLRDLRLIYLFLWLFLLNENAYFCTKNLQHQIFTHQQPLISCLTESFLKKKFLNHCTILAQQFGIDFVSSVPSRGRAIVR